jgi:hypothetical protein
MVGKHTEGERGKPARRDRTRVALRTVAAASGACAAILSLTAGTAAARTLSVRDAVHVDASAPSANFVGARFLSIDGSPARRALLRFALPAGKLTGVSLRVHATARSTQGLTIRTSSCAWKARTVTSRTRPRGGRRIAVRGSLAAGWNTIALPAKALRAGTTACLQVIKDGRARIRLARSGARTPRLAVRTAASSSSKRAVAPSGRPTSRPLTWAAPPPPSTPGYCAAVSGSWPGTGRTIVVRPGQSLQAAVDAATAGDTIELADGTYARATVTLNKAVRLRAANPFGAVLIGNATPRTANDTSVGTPTSSAVTVDAGGAMVEGLDIRYYAKAVHVSDVAGAVVQGNRITSSYGVGVNLWDTRNSEVRCNEILDPYLADDPVGSLTAGSISDAQMDYGVASYGSIAPRVHHNYFHGIFNQTLSFKEGNRDPYAGYNTFEGFNLTALFFGQNLPHNGPYEFTGLPQGPDHGSLVAEYNVFRNVYGLRGAEKVVYHARSPLRVWHVDGNTTLRGNVIESARQGFLLECRSGADAGCAAGTILVQHNTVAGRVQGLSGALTNVNSTAGVMLFDGLPARVTIDANAFAMLPATVKRYAGGVAGTPSSTETNNVVLSSSSANLALRQARAATDPDLSHADAYRTP